MDRFVFVLVKCGNFFLVFALILALGGHWALLQSVAWVGMTIENSRGLPLKEALIKTFDGKHPCSLCKFVAEGKKSEKKPQAQTLTTKLDLFFVSSPIEIRRAPFPSPNAVISIWGARK